MARPIFNIDEANIKNALVGNIKNRFGNISENKDSTLMAFSESIADELTMIRRENSFKLNSLQMSNATENDLDEIAMNMYGLLRRSATRASARASESNLYFYVEEGTFGDINNGNDITIPEGTAIFIKTNAYGENIIYETVEEYTLNNELNRGYCGAVSTDTGFSQNVERDSLNFHNFEGYASVQNNLLKVTNRFPIINGSDLESDDMFRTRISNYLSSRINLNEDWILLKALTIPGITDIKLIQNYFGIGTLGVVVYGAGKQNNESLLNLVERRVREVSSPGLNIEVVPGITVYLDFDIRVYIKRGLNVSEKENIKSLIKEFVYRSLENGEANEVIDFETISNYIRRIIPDNNIIGFGSATSGSMFEKIYCRKTDRYDAFPEYREEIISSRLILQKEENIGFGEVNIILEEDNP